MTKDAKEDKVTDGLINERMVSGAIAEGVQDAKVRAWLAGQGGYLAEMINVYAADPDTFGLHPDLRKDPLLILKTVLHSADTLYKYQQAYNKALSEVAVANGVDASKLDEVPGKLQESTLEKEHGRIVAHLADGGNVAIGLMGSGASGKGTVGKRAGMERAVNVTTRPMRPGEAHGKDYLYIRVLEPQTAETLDIDTGYNVVGRDASGQPVYETDAAGEAINYFDKYGPYVTTVHRPGRARHGTPVSEFQKHFDKGEKTIFFEHGPVQVEEAGRKVPDLVPGAIVLPVCILPPKTGVLPLALRIAVRTYGDANHRDPNVTNGYAIKESYLESTIGFGQIDELAMTAGFSRGEKPLGIAYIVNDKLADAVEALRGLTKN